MTSTRPEVAGLFVLCVFGLWFSAPVSASPVLDAWRSDVGATRILAENDISRAYAQAQRLQASMPSDAAPADHARILNLLARTEIYGAQTELAAKHIREARDIATSNGDRVGVVEADLNIALNAVNQGRIDDMVGAVKDSMDMLQGVNRPDLLAEAMLRTSMMYRRLGQLDQSVTVAMQAMDVAKHTGDPLVLAYAQQGMAITYDQSGHTGAAREHFVQMRDAARAAHSALLEAEALLGLGFIDATAGDTAGGMHLVQQAISMHRRIGGPFYLSHALFQLATVYRIQGQYAKALPLLDETVAIYRQRSNVIGLWWSLNMRSFTFQTLGRTAAARADAEESYALAKQLGVPVYLAGSAQRMASVMAEIGDFKRAYEFSAEAAEMNSRAEREKSSEQILRLAERYQNESKQRQIDELNRRNEQQALQQRWLWTVFGASSILLAISVFFLLRLRRSQRFLEAANISLQEAKSHQEAILDTIPDLLFEMGLDGRYYDLHYSRLDLLAAPVEDVLGKRVVDILPADVAAVCLSALQEAHEKGASTGKQYALQLPHGKHWFELSVARKSVAEGEEPRFIILSRDITDRKVFEEALQEREQRYREIFDNATDGLYLLEVTPEGRFRNIDVNPALERSTGLSRVDLIGRFVDETVSEETGRRVVEKYRRCVERGEAIEEEVVLELPVGKRYYHSTLIPLRDGSGRIHRIVGVSNDITDSKLYEAELLKRAEVEARLSKLVAAAPGMLGTFVLTAEGHAYIPDAGPRLEDLTGFRPEQVGKAGEGVSVLRTAIHPEDLPRHQESIAESARNLTPWRSEFRLNHPVKGEIWIEGRSMPERLPDGSTIWYGFLHDVTERKNAEAELAKHREHLAELVQERTAELRESEARYRRQYNLMQSILESPSSSVSFYALDREYRYLAFNSRFREAAKRLWGADIAIGMSMLDAVDTEAHREFCRQGFDSVLAGCSYGLDSCEERIENGKPIYEYHENYGSPIRNDNGEILGLTVFVLNITERKQAEEQIRRLNEELEQRVSERTAQLELLNMVLSESERRFRTLAENAPDIIMRYDWDCCRLYVNPAYERETTVSLEQAINTPPDAEWRGDITMPVEEYKGHLRRVMETGESTDFVMGWTHPGGRVSYHAIRIVAEYDGNGQVTGALAMGYNITALKEVEHRLEESRTQLRELAARRDRAREEERKRIARELHDELGQYLTALKFKTSALDIEFGTALPALSEKLHQMMELVDATKQVVRNVAAALRPAALDMGLASAIEWMAEEFSKRTDVSCTLKLEEDTAGLGDMGVTVAFRIAQESLTNVARHAEASSVTISLERKDGYSVLEIRDDGKGFDPAVSKNKSFGLLGMRERLLMMAGSLDVSSVPGRGTTVRACIPAQE